MDNKEKIGDLLQKHGFKKTTIRIQILELFMSHNFALAASDIISKLKTNHDRVTVFRALNSFEEKGLLHKASEDGQGVKYALCGHSCPDKTHTDQHAHFVCDECNHTYCLEDLEVPIPNVSKGFSISRINYTLGGVCNECEN